MFRIFIAAALVAGAAAVGAASVASADAASPYPNSKTAAKDGRHDIPSNDPAYGPWLDRDNDGVGCES
ncbi:MAG: hypothetical protein QOD39_5580 [Mycobacterium sp.]|nr:hypothetical protein [Mycobacterium sp.]